MRGTWSKLEILINISKHLSPDILLRGYNKCYKANANFVVIHYVVYFKISLFHLYRGVICKHLKRIWDEFRSGGYHFLFWGQLCNGDGGRKLQVE